jgi:hypothetical protein
MSTAICSNLRDCSPNGADQWGGDFPGRLGIIGGKEDGMKNTLIFIIFMLIVLGVLSLLSGTRAPRIPEDALHAGITDNAVCQKCHAPGTPTSLKQNHPPKTECVICHKRKRTVKPA